MTETWRNGLDDVVALGINVSRAQRQVINHGGEVLVIQGLPEPGQTSTAMREQRPAVDQYGNLLMVCAILYSTPPDTVALPRFPDGRSIITMADLLDQTFSDHLATTFSDHWAYWPSYIGGQKEIPDCFWQNLNRLQCVRVWGGIPIVSPAQRDAAERLTIACRDRIDLSAYEEMDFIKERAENLDLPIDPELHPGEEIVFDDGDETALDILRDLASVGLWDMKTNQETGAPIQYYAMEEILENDLTGKRMWNALVAQSRNGARQARAAIPQKKLALYDFLESDFEPWL
jgi:hypothetical protein